MMVIAEQIRQNRKYNLLVFILLILFVVTGFNNLFWIALIPMVIIAFMYDIKHGCVYTKSAHTGIIDISIFLLCILEVVAILSSIYKPNSLVAVQRVLLICAFWLFARVFVRFRKQQTICVEGLSFLGGFLSFVAIICFLVHRHKFYHLGFTDLIDFRQYYHPLGYISNDWVAVLLCFLPFSATAYCESKHSIRKLLHLLSFGLITLSLLTSFSRAAYLSLAFFILSYLYLLLKYSKKRLRGGIILLSVSFLTIGVVAAMDGKSLATTISMSKTTVQKRSIEGRYKKWDEAIQIHHLSPALGIGGGNYAIVSDNCIQDKRTNMTDRSTNSYLQLLVEKGYICAAGFLLMIIIFIVTCVHRLQQDAFGIFFCAAMVALAIREFFFSSFFILPELPVLTILMLFMSIHPVDSDEYEIFW